MKLFKNVIDGKVAGLQISPEEMGGRINQII
jgi:hypothetical protein